ncbi:MAG: biotin/lipoyl-containing protein [Candidatus Limnocylindria bacterium]|nr:biotin/lipoyl-containing protein [Candidatus Limnocylindria bacterium]
MSEPDPILALLDDLVQAVRGSAARTIEVSADSFSLSVTRDDASAVEAVAPGALAVATAEVALPRTQRVHAPAVGIFSATRAWVVGDRVARGDALGAIQTLGHLAEIGAPADGTIAEVLASAGSPVEYGQPLFAITLG